VWLDSAGGGAIMLFSTLQFLVVLFVAPRYGLIARWLRLKRMVPQQTVEDILQTVFRHQEGPTPLKTIEDYVKDKYNIARAVHSLIDNGLLERQAEGVSLTANGHTEAVRILRAHRLWETYLHHVGVPETEIHDRAHVLEHMDRGATVDYLDKLLQHPKTDPHGQAIPPRQ
jgi:manganese/iron transport system permease protein/iron/zinc/copper transport system permease protein